VSQAEDARRTPGVLFLAEAFGYRASTTFFCDR
jgi:hypothetical protein